VFLLLPQFEELYADNFNFQIQENSLSKILCGFSRPGHFTGVLTVVMKLLNIAQAQNAYFGEKDFQQFVLVRELTNSFFLNTHIISCPIIREKDGLAMSSRNQLLTCAEREIAPRLYQILKKENSITQIKEELNRAGFRTDYVEEKWGRKLAAVFLGATRLIDNVPV
jgi:pantoate--beta-alanine ligase